MVFKVWRYRRQEIVIAGLKKMEEWWEEKKSGKEGKREERKGGRDEGKEALQS